MNVRVATCIPKQLYTTAEKLAWLDKAILDNPCDLFLTSQEYFGGGSIREICKQKGITTDDIPQSLPWLDINIGGLAKKHGVHIGVGASTTYLTGDTTENFIYYDNEGTRLGYHAKIALPRQDSVALDGASGITPETNYSAAVKVIELPKLGIKIGTVFCWQVFFMQFWNDLYKQGCNLVAHPIKFAPRAWYKKGQNAEGLNVRTGFTQNKGSELAEDDALGWIRKLMFESEFKLLPIAVTCNTWAGGEQFLALEGWIDEVSQTSNLHHLPSVPETEIVTVTSFDPTLYAKFDNWSNAYYGEHKEVFNKMAAKTMMRKALGIEARTISGQAAAKFDAHREKPEVANANPDQQRIF